MATALKQSDYIGVFLTNPEADYAKDVPYRVAMPIRKEGEETEWVYGGFFKTEHTAARAYNLIAIEHMGSNAIINDIGKPTKSMNDEFADFLSQNPNRAQRYKLTTEKAKELIAKYGAFKTHKDVQKALPTTPEIANVL